MNDDPPAADGVGPGHFPPSPVMAGHVAPCPRRVRGVVEGATIVDTCAAWYGWEHPYYPQFHIPDSDIETDRLAPTGRSTSNALGRFEVFDLITSDRPRTDAARRLVEPTGGLAEGVWNLEWACVDRWFEESEEVHGHPRSPYVRVDAIRSERHLEVRAAGATIAEATSVVCVFETGLPTRYYFDPTAVHWEALQSTDTTAECPYKGVTSGYWCLDEDPSGVDVAWSYGFPTRELAPIAGMVAFVDDRVDVIDHDGGTVGSTQ